MPANEPLITVIVPCYNVEKYINKCISSIIEQKYSNLDILLINDGSTDSTGIICDNWQEKDKRIRVIHKQNEGLAYARKTGIKNTTAEYVAFVDSDDWIAPEMYSDMMNVLLTSNSDIVQCDLCFIYDDGCIEQRIERHSGSVTILSRIEGVLLLLNDQMWRMSYCTKIYKKSLFDDIIFPKGRAWGEDYVNHELFHKASQTVLLDKAYYFYYQRNDSITKIGDIEKEIKTINDMSNAYYNRYIFVKQNPEYHIVLNDVKYLATCVGILLLRNMTLYSKKCNKELFYSKVKQLRSIHYTKEEYLPRSFKVELFTLKIGANWYKTLRTFYNLIVQITNKLKITNRLTSFLMSDNFWVTLNNYIREYSNKKQKP